MKVLFIDRWSKHSLTTHFIPLSQELNRRSINCEFWHFGSLFGQEVYNKDYESIKVRDIRTFGSGFTNACSLLKRINPNIVIFSGAVNQPINQAILIAAKFMNVNVGWIQFGTFNLDPKDKGVKQKGTFISQFVSIISLLHSFKFLILSLIVLRKLRANFSLLKDYIRNLWTYRENYVHRESSYFINPSFTLLFSKDGLNQWIKKGVLRNYVCGNITIQTKTERQSIDKHSCLIIMQPLFEVKVVKSMQFLLEEYTKIVEQCKRNGFKPIVKLHPLNSFEFERDLRKKLQNTQIIRDGVMDSLIQRSSLVIGVSSTSLISSIYYRVPTIIVEWLAPNHVSLVGYSKESVFNICNSFEAYLSKIGEVRPMNEEARKTFLDSYVGPSIGEGAVKSMVDAIENEMNES